MNKSEYLISVAQKTAYDDTPLSNRVTEVETTLEDVADDVEGLLELAGDSTLDTTAQTLTGAINELNSKHEQSAQITIADNLELYTDGHIAQLVCRGIARADLLLLTIPDSKRPFVNITDVGKKAPSGGGSQEPNIINLFSNGTIYVEGADTDTIYFSTMYLIN